LGNLAGEALSLRESLLRPYLPQIRAPVLIIWGDGDRILDVGGVSVLEKNLNNYKTVIMKKTGHTPMLEKPQETASYYTGYLKGNKQDLIRTVQ
jgi:abhydrolase domain-containing protein 6